MTIHPGHAAHDDKLRPKVSLESVRSGDDSVGDLHPFALTEKLAYAKLGSVKRTICRTFIRSQTPDDL
jgi:hypothetical protein